MPGRKPRRPRGRRRGRAPQRKARKPAGRKKPAKKSLRRRVAPPKRRALRAKARKAIAPELPARGATPLTSGVDVSHYQGEVGWNAAAKSLRFAFAKATDGLRTDPTFSANWKGMKDAGILRGAYHFFRPLVDAEAQASHFCDVVGAVSPSDLPPVVDVETAPDGGGGDQWDSVPLLADKVAALRRFVELVEARLGRAPIVYTGRAFWNSKFGGDSSFSRLPLWIANYTSAAAPRIPKGWDKWAFWQYSESGKIRGVRGNVDLDRFNGSIDELRAFSGLT